MDRQLPAGVGFHLDRFDFLWVEPMTKMFSSLYSLAGWVSLKLPATTIRSSITIGLWCSLRSLAKAPARLGTYSSMLGCLSHLGRPSPGPPARIQDPLEELFHDLQLAGVIRGEQHPHRHPRKVIGAGQLPMQPPAEAARCSCSTSAWYRRQT